MELKPVSRNVLYKIKPNARALKKYRNSFFIFTILSEGVLFDGKDKVCAFVISNYDLKERKNDMKVVLDKAGIDTSVINWDEIKNGEEYFSSDESGINSEVDRILKDKKLNQNDK